VKKLIIILIILFFTSIVFGQDVIVVKKKGGCNPASNEVGDRSVESTTEGLNTDMAVCFLTSADCSGTLGVAYAYQLNYTTTCKVGVYTSDGSSPNANCTKVGVSASISGSEAWDWYTVAGDLGGLVTSSTNYWVCIFVGSTAAWGSKRASGSGAYYKYSSGYYASPPDNLGTGWGAISWSPISMYVEIK